LKIALQRPYNPRQNQTPNGQKPTRSKSGVLESDSSDEDSQKGWFFDIYFF